MRVNSYGGGQNNFYGNNNYGSQDFNSYGKRSKLFNLVFEINLPKFLILILS
jgi:hypothetical protein